MSGSHAINQMKTRAGDEVGITVLFRKIRRRIEVRTGCCCYKQGIFVICVVPRENRCEHNG